MVRSFFSQPYFDFVGNSSQMKLLPRSNWWNLIIRNASKYQATNEQKRGERKWLSTLMNEQWRLCRWVISFIMFESVIITPYFIEKCTTTWHVVSPDKFIHRFLVPVPLSRRSIIAPDLRQIWMCLFSLSQVDSIADNSTLLWQF